MFVCFFQLQDILSCVRGCIRVCLYSFMCVYIYVCVYVVICTKDGANGAVEKLGLTRFFGCRKGRVGVNVRREVYRVSVWRPVRVEETDEGPSSSRPLCLQLGAL